VSHVFIQDHIADFPIQAMCEVLGVSRSSYYDWVSRSDNARAVKDRGAVVAEIRTAHEVSGGCYGRPRVHAVLRAPGRRVGHTRVACLKR
jgi:hypothetical protein